MKPRIKILSLGCVETGKTLLIKRFCENQFEKRYEPTIGVDYGSTVAQIKVANKMTEVVIDFFDTSGSDEYAGIRIEFYQNIDGILLVYDINNVASFDALDKLLSEGKNHGLDINSNIFVVCGNKTDQPMQQVSEKDGKEYAKKLQKSFHFETSALNGYNVESAFKCLFENVMLSRLSK